MINLKPFYAIVLSVLFLTMDTVKAQWPSNDPAYTLVWADSFPGTFGGKIDTSKWNQKWPWNQPDSISLNCYTNPSSYLDVAYDKWYLNTPGDYYIDTLNHNVSGGNLVQTCRKQTFNLGQCWT